MIVTNHVTSLPARVLNDPMVLLLIAQNHQVTFGQSSNLSMNNVDTPSHTNELDPNNGTLQEMIDDPDPEDLTEEDPLTLDPSKIIL